MADNFYPLSTPFGDVEIYPYHGKMNIRTRQADRDAYPEVEKGTVQVNGVHYTMSASVSMELAWTTYSLDRYPIDYSISSGAAYTKAENARDKFEKITTPLLGEWLKSTIGQDALTAGKIREAEADLSTSQSMEADLREKLRAAVRQRIVMQDALAELRGEVSSGAAHQAYKDAMQQNGGEYGQDDRFTYWMDDMP